MTYTVIFEDLHIEYINAWNMDEAYYKAHDIDGHGKIVDLYLE